MDQINSCYLIKLLVIGDSGVGKSCILSRFVDDTFSPSFVTTIGIDFKIKTMEIDGKYYKLQIWDTAGQERFRTITNAYYRGAMGIILVYDVTNTKSFQNVRQWIHNIDQNTDSVVSKILVGNKCDSNDQRTVTKNMLEEEAKKYDIPYIEVSAKNNINVDNIFLNITKSIKKRLDETIVRPQNNVDNVDLNKVEPVKTKKCCN